MSNNKKRYSLISKPDITICRSCNGLGVYENPKSFDYGENCKTCGTTGKWIENHYIVIDEVNKIAFDTDSGG